MKWKTRKKGQGRDQRERLRDGRRGRGGGKEEGEKDEREVGDRTRASKQVHTSPHAPLPRPHIPPTLPAPTYVQCTWFLLPCELLDQPVKGPGHHLVLTPFHLVDQNILAICSNSRDGSLHNYSSFQKGRMLKEHCVHCR